MLLYVFPVCYDVRLSHLNKDYLLTYFLTRQIGQRDRGRGSAARVASLYT